MPRSVGQTDGRNKSTRGQIPHDIFDWYLR